MNGKRLAAAGIDFLICAMIQAMLMVFYIFKPILLKEPLPSNIISLAIKITMVSLIYLFLRDIIGSRSIGKRIMNQKVINSKTNQSANIFQRLLRNITLVLGVIEIIVLIIKGKRLGDLLANTTVESGQ